MKQKKIKSYILLSIILSSFNSFASDTINLQENFQNSFPNNTDNTNRSFILNTINNSEKILINGIPFINYNDIVDFTIKNDLYSVLLKDQQLFSGILNEKSNTVNLILDTKKTNAFIYGQPNELVAIIKNQQHKIKGLDNVTFDDFIEFNVNDEIITATLKDLRKFVGSLDLNDGSIVFKPDNRISHVSNILFTKTNNKLTVFYNHNMISVPAFDITLFDEITSIHINNNKLFVLLDNGNLLIGDINNNSVPIITSSFSNVSSVLFSNHDFFINDNKNLFNFKKNNKWIKTLYKNIRSVSVLNGSLYALSPDGIVLISNFNTDDDVSYMSRSFLSDNNVEDLSVLSINNHVLKLINKKTSKLFIINFNDRDLSVKHLENPLIEKNTSVSS